MKRWRNMLIMLISAIVLLVFCIEVNDDTLDIYVSYTVNGIQQKLSCWKEGECYYVFLPGYVDLADVTLCNSSGKAVEIAGESLKGEMACSGFQTDVSYDMTYHHLGNRVESKLMFVQSSGVASMYIDTESGNMNYIHATKGNEEKGTLRLVTSDGNLDYEGELKYIKGRGNSTWENCEKKPYSIKLLEEAELLGMDAAQKWILIANAEDTSQLRNKIVYDFASEIGLAYSPEAQWVNLYLNGSYAGLYLLCERNEVSESRVDISSDDGFLVSMELEGRLEEHPYVQTQENQYFRIHFPEVANGDTSGIAETLQSMENAILSEDGIDANSGKSWQEQIDLESWVKKYLVEEVFGNIDACAISQFFYWDETNEGGKLYAGPVWDYDYTMGNEANWQLSATDAFYANRLHVRENIDTPWFNALYQKEDFYDMMVNVYADEFLPELQELLEQRIDEYAAQIHQAANANGIRWKIQDDVLTEGDEIKAFLQGRIDFLNRAWLADEEYYQVCADGGNGGCFAYYAVQEGACLDALPVLEDRDGQHFVAWYDAATDEPFDISQPIYGDVKLYAKWEGVSDVWRDRIVKLIPLGVISIFLTIFVIVDIGRNKCRR